MKILAAAFLLVGLSAQAAVEVYENPTGAKLTIETTKKESYIKIEGVDTKWAGKVIKVEKAAAATGKERYSFDYQEEIGGEKVGRTYTVIVQIGDKYEDNKAKKQVEIHFPEGDINKPVKVWMDLDETKKSQKVSLAAEAKKSPYTPDVDAD